MKVSVANAEWNRGIKVRPPNPWFLRRRASEVQAAAKIMMANLTDGCDPPLLRFKSPFS